MTINSNLNIKLLLGQLKIQYYLFLLIIVLVGFGSKFLFEDITIENKELVIQLQSLALLLTLGGLPLSLKLFSRYLKKITLRHNNDTFFNVYKKSAAMRLLAIGFIACLNLILYFRTKELSFILSSGICMVFSVFCIPSLKKLKYELFPDIDINSDDQED